MSKIDNYKPGRWFKAKSLDEMEAFFWSRLPEIREAAKEHGYAIGVHGSARRDFDLIATPWRKGASDKDVLANAIQMAACGIDSASYQWENKPAGRVATAFPILWTADIPDCPKISAGHIDLSVVCAENPTPADIAVEVCDRCNGTGKWGWSEAPDLYDCDDCTRQQEQADGEAHPDDVAIDKFAAAMKEKMAKKRSEGKRGWSDKEDCTTSFLNYCLSDHVRKGDPVDVGNFAMMLFNRGERTAYSRSLAELQQPAPVSAPETDAADGLSALDMIFQIFASHCENMDVDMPDDEDEALLAGCKAEIRAALQAKAVPDGLMGAFSILLNEMKYHIEESGCHYTNANHLEILERLRSNISDAPQLGTKGDVE